MGNLLTMILYSLHPYHPATRNGATRSQHHQTHDACQVPPCNWWTHWLAACDKLTPAAAQEFNPTHIRIRIYSAGVCELGLKLFSTLILITHQQLNPKWLLIQVPFVSEWSSNKISKCPPTEDHLPHLQQNRLRTIRLTAEQRNKNNSSSRRQSRV